MKAIVVSKPGGPEQLALEDVPDLTPARAEVLIDVHAAALNRADLLQRRGLYPPPTGTTDILGMECAGVVRALGPDCAGLVDVGERVMLLLPGGGYAEGVTASEALLMKVPENLGLEQAAAIPEAFLTAHEAMLVTGELRPGESVLIHAAAGGVGSAAVQLAKAVGARVFATAGGVGKCEWVRRLGADVVIDYKTQSFAEVIARETNSGGVDVILDFVGAAFVEQHAACLAPRGRHVVIGLLSGDKAHVDFGRLLQKRQSIRGVVMRTRSLQEKIELTRAFKRTHLPLFSNGRLKPLVDRVFPLSAVREAHERMERNENMGKIVLKVR